MIGRDQVIGRHEFVWPATPPWRAHIVEPAHRSVVSRRAFHTLRSTAVRQPEESLSACRRADRRADRAGAAVAMRPTSESFDWCRLRSTSTCSYEALAWYSLSASSGTWAMPSTMT